MACLNCGYAEVETGVCPRCGVNVTTRREDLDSSRQAAEVATPETGRPAARSAGADPQEIWRGAFAWWSEHPWIVVWGFLAILMLATALLNQVLSSRRFWPYLGIEEKSQLPGLEILLFLFIGAAFMVVLLMSAVLSCRGRPLWKRLLQLLILGGMPLLIFLVFLPSLLPWMRSGVKSNYDRAAMETKEAVFQSTVYANDKGVYPASIKALRYAGYANIADTDAWGRDWVLSPVLSEGRAPGKADDLYIYSKGRRGKGTYPLPFTSDTGKDGSVGYSSTYGSWKGK